MTDRTRWMKMLQLRRSRCVRASVSVSRALIRVICVLQQPDTNWEEMFGHFYGDASSDVRHNATQRCLAPLLSTQLLCTGDGSAGSR